MRLQIFDNGFNVWISANDTWKWANRPREKWPCSTLADKRFFAQFDSNGLCELTVEGVHISDYEVRGNWIDPHELSACICDMIKDKLPQDHPSWIVAVWQFLSQEELNALRESA